MTELEVIDAEIGQELVVAEHAPTNLFRADDPAEIVARAASTAEALSGVLKKQKLTSSISGREHVRVEGWTLLGSMLGVFPVCTWTRKLDNGWEARVEARTLSGAVVGAAEAECLRSENSWKNRDDFALRSMAQTRATSKALRQPLGFVVSLAGFDPTPAEEMTFSSGATGHGSGRENPSEQVSAGSSAAPDTPSAEAPPPGHPSAEDSHLEPADPATRAHIAALVKEAAALRRVPQKNVKDALVADGYTPAMSQAKAEELVGKLERWCATLKGGAS